MYEELVSDLRKGYTDRLKEAADAIEELTGFVQEAERDRDEYRERLDKANDAIEELSRVAEVNAKRAMFWAAQAEKYNWISVTERLPEDRSDVFAYLKYEMGGRIAAANYDKGIWQDCVMGGLYRTEEGVVTHWMPIPEPPKEENND